jgi:arabinofuranosyltransferase
MQTSTYSSEVESGVGRSWDRLDLILLPILVLMTAVLVWRGISWESLPAEDALMLMRYATHLAGGHGIVWNIGDPPVEGATDFLYLVLLSGWMKISHLGAIIGARTFLAAAHVAGVAVLYVASRRVAEAGYFVSFLVASYLSLGPGLLHAANGFSSAFYGLMALCAWCFAVTSVKHGVNTLRCVGFSSFALLTGLTRPDGVLLAIFMTCALMYALGRASKKIVLTTVGVFVVLGGAYFLWRFHYFGHLLPNPFYKKGGGHLYVESLKASTGNVVKMLMPFVPVFLLGLIVPRTRRMSVFCLIPLAGFSVIWVLLTNENNLAMRFQYVILPMGLLSVAVITQGLLVQLRTDRPAMERLRVPAWGAVACSVMLAICFHLWWRLMLETPELVGTGPYHIAVGLSRYEDRHYTLVATEAGVIPYFSRWRVIDGWGLNDAEIVHNPQGMTAGYLDQNHPAIIMMYAPSDDMADFRRIWKGLPPPAENIRYVMDQASHYAMTHGYVVAARWGMTPCAVNIWYLRRDLPEYDEMLKIIQQEPHLYPYNEAGLGTNFLQDDPPATCGDNKSVVTRTE